MVLYMAGRVGEISLYYKGTFGFENGRKGLECERLCESMYSSMVVIYMEDF